MKAQQVRLFDIFVLGPLMVWGGWKLQGEYPLAGQTLLLGGVGTVLYNGRNYMRIQREGLIPGGYAAGKSAKDFDSSQLRAGMRVEMEHTTEPDIAREIAMDHLMEDPRYYEKLLRAGL